jgi:hypothetical protein
VRWQISRSCRRVFEKDGVVGFILLRWTFEVLCAGARGDPGKAIDFRGAFGPERNPVLARHVAGRFGGGALGHRFVSCYEPLLTRKFRVRFARWDPRTILLANG